MENHRPVTRRGVLAGFGAAGVVGVLGTGSSVAVASGPQNGGAGQADSNASASDFAGAFVAVPQTKILNTISWVPYPNATYQYVVAGGVRPTAGTQFWNCAIDLPPGSTIQSVSVFLNPGGTSTFINLARYDGTTGGFVDIKSANSSAGSSIETVTIADINHVVLGAPWAYRIDNLTLNTSRTLYGGMVTYLPPPAGYIALSPTPRVVNTRDNAEPKLAANEERTVDVSAHVPANAQAVVLNLTVTQTEGGGFVALFPADVAWPGNSNINWSGPGLSIANMAITELDAAARFKMRGGANPTHVIVDVLGYLLAP